ncbi:hypothetical protein LRZ95_01770 [Candidatus Gracilibacteria bacterium]|nr:hypothetical protein [Candidatus Gracilibacteria bacterium]
MKKIIYFLLFSLVISISNTVYASKNQDNIIKKAVLVENYIKKHKEKIEKFIDKYDIKDSKYIKNNIKELNESILALNKIKNSQISNEKSEEIIKTILKRIKYINENLKEKLIIEQQLFEKKLKRKKEIYSRLGDKLSNKIDQINIKIIKSIYSNNKISNEKKEKIKNNLMRLNKESKKLKYFGKINFKSEKEIKDSFVRILKNIKREVKIMKNTLKKRETV